MSPWQPEWLDAMYNNRALVPDFADHLARWASSSAAVRASHPCVCDVPYGDGELEVLDIFPGAAQGAPVLVFLHGGYWRSLDKADHSFVAPAFTAGGACVVLPNYALCPATTVTGITLQMVKALAWVWRNIARHGGDPTRITVAGHSAGGQLAAMMLACLWPTHGADLPPRLVRNALSISGLHDLEPIRHTPFLQPDLQLTAEQVRQASPAGLPGPGLVKGRGQLCTVAGGHESDEFKRQNALMREAWGARVVPVAEVLPGLNHFSILTALVTPGHRLHQLTRDLLSNRPVAPVQQGD